MTDDKTDEVKPTAETHVAFPEAGAVAFFGYKRTDGFEVSLTLKDETGNKLLKRLEGAIKEIKEAGGTPLPLRGNGGFNKASKPVEYVEGRTCPQDGANLVYAQKKDGTKFIKCANQKWDAVKKQAIGCSYVDWGNAPQQPVSQPPASQYNSEELANEY